MDQWNRMESPGINSDTYSQLIFNKRGKNIKWEKVSSAMILGKLDSRCKSMKLEHTFTSCPKVLETRKTLWKIEQCYISIVFEMELPKLFNFYI